MNRFSENRSDDPTRSRPKTVATKKEETSRALRRILVFFLAFLRRERPLPTTVEEANLSSWIFQLHCLATEESSHEYRLSAFDVQVMPSLATWIKELAGPKLDLGKIADAMAKLKKIGERAEALASIYCNDRKQFDVQFRLLANQVINAWKVPETSQISQLSSLEGALRMARATRVLGVCLAVHGVHPLSLIASASKRDRQATLDLVKIDKLFLHDACTQRVIKEAELRNDRSFMEQLARAMEYRPKLSSRMVYHLYFYVLFLLEKLGAQLPTMYELWQVLDPHGREYDSLSAFERDFQRRREAFVQMVSDAESQFKHAKL